MVRKLCIDVLYVLTNSLFSVPLKATHLGIESARMGGLSSSGKLYLFDCKVQHNVN